MILTLRTLLAYLDDTLDPAEAHEIGQKVAELPRVQELIERIKKVTRRRGLTVPLESDPDYIDANTVAEYLDNVLPADKVAEVEEHALHSDVNLAEIAACHQILSLVLCEQAHVPPPARERMYQLVQGKESEPNRRAARVGPAEYPAEIALADEMRAARKGIGYRLMGAGALAVGLVFAIWQALPTRPAREIPLVPEGRPDNGIMAAAPKLAEIPKDKEPTAIEPKPQDKAAPPVEPKAADKAPPVVEPKPQDKAAPPVEAAVNRAASTDSKELAQFVTRDAVLLEQRAEGPWVRVVPDGRVASVRTLMSLPGSRSELRLESGAKLTLWGNLPDWNSWQLLESVATLHVPPTGYDLDFTLDRGRVYIGTTKKTPIKVRARAAGTIWDMKFQEPAEVMFEAVTLFGGQPFRREGTSEPPARRVTVASLAGQVAFENVDRPLPVVPNTLGFQWDNAPQGTPVALTTASPAWAKTPVKAPARDRQADIDAAQRKLVQRIGEKSKPIELALAEVGQDSSRAAQALATFSNGALGILQPVLDALEDPASVEVRQAAVYALCHLVANRVGGDQQVYEQLQVQKNYGEREAEHALMLMHGFTEEAQNNPETYNFLFRVMASEKLGDRELAHWRLTLADPEGASRIRFNPADPPVAREKALAEWRRRIPEDKLPPKGSTQGRLPSRSTSRG